MLLLLRGHAQSDAVEDRWVYVPFHRLCHFKGVQNTLPPHHVSYKPYSCGPAAQPNQDHSATCFQSPCHFIPHGHIQAADQAAEL